MAKIEYIDERVETDRVRLKKRQQPDLELIVRDHIASFANAHLDNERIQTACRILQAMLRDHPSMAHLCTTRRELQRLLTADEFGAIKEDLRQRIANIGEDLDEYRNPLKPLYPDTIISHEMADYKGRHWYAASFLHDDPEAGVTSRPHFAFICLPESIMENGKDLPMDFFEKSRILAGEPVIVRVHSECFLGDTKMSQTRCDCGAQLAAAMRKINKKGRGVILYLKQEGRGMGMTRKMRALSRAEGRVNGHWIDEEFDTSEAMLAEMPEECQRDDLRDYYFALRMMKGLGMPNIHLMTNNRKKLEPFIEGGIMATQIHATGQITSFEGLNEALWKILSKNYVPPDFSLTAINIIRELHTNVRAGSYSMRESLRRRLSELKEKHGRDLPSRISWYIQSILYHANKKIEEGEGSNRIIKALTANKTTKALIYIYDELKARLYGLFYHAPWENGESNDDSSLLNLAIKTPDDTLEESK